MASNLDTLASINSDMARNNAGQFNPTQDFGFRPDPTLSATPVDQSATPDQLPPISTQLPKYRTSAQDKWNALVPLASQFGIGNTALKTVYTIDQQRLAKGSPPLDNATTVQMLRSAQQLHPVTTPPKPHASNVLGNIASDFESVAGSLLHLPQAVGQEIENIPKIPQELKAATSGNADVGKKLENVLHNVDLINFIPGTHTLGDVAGRNFEDIGLHPLRTVLDLLPAASKLAEYTPAGSLAEDIRTESGTTAAPRPLKASALFKVAQVPELDEAGNPTGAMRPTLIRNPLGEQVFKIANESGIGSSITSKFGGTLREGLFQPLARLQSGIHRSLTGEIPPSWADKDIAEAGAAGLQLAKKHDMSPQDVNDAYKIGVTFNPADPTTQAILDARPNLERYLIDARQLTSVFAAKMTSPIEDIINKYGRVPLKDPNLLASHNGEVFTPEQASKVYSAERGATRAENFLHANIAPQLTELGNKPFADPRITDVAQKISDGDYVGARSDFQKLMAAKGGLGQSEVRATGPRPADLEYGLPGGDISDATKKNISNAFDKAVGMRTASDKLSNATAPARYGDWIINKTAENLEMRLAPDASPTAVEALHKAVTARDYQPLFDQGIITQQQWDAEAKEVAATWKTAQDAGMDPIFFHHVSPAAVGGMLYPKILPQITDVSSARERTWDPQPYVPDYGIAIAHQGMELLRRQAQEQGIDDVVRTYGVKTSDLIARYAKRIEKMTGANEDYSTAASQNEVLSKGWGKFDPESLVGYRPARWADLTGGEQVWLPKPVLKALEDMRAPAQDNLLTKISDPVMGPFRASVLTLSPRFMANTILGGMFESVGANPGGLARLYQAAQVFRGADEFDVTVNRFNPFKPTETYTLKVPDEYRELLDMAKRERDQLGSQLDMRAGTTLGRWFQKAQDLRASKVGQIGQSVYDAPLDVHNFFGNLYRSAALVGGAAKGLVEGMDPETAVKEGLRLTQRILPQWDALSPFERSVVRSVFPFYTWSQHIMSYVYNLPLDHPTRVAVINSLANNVIKDEKTGWPQLFRSMLLLGKPDAKGEQSAIKLNGGNPFTDVSSLWSLQGFLKGVNPLVETGLNAVGIKEGEPELYANTDYNPETGKLEANTGNPLLNLLHNTVPQSDWIASLLGRNEDYEAQIKNNPQAAHSRFLSDVGIPQFFGKVNVADSSARQEMTIYKAMLANQSAGLKAGNVSQVNEYPDSTAYTRQLLALSPKQLQPFEPSATPGPSPAQQSQISALTPHPL